jgi:hypothetical protein
MSSITAQPPLLYFAAVLAPFEGFFGWQKCL